VTAPLTPIQFNARFCLKTPHVPHAQLRPEPAEHFNGIPGSSRSARRCRPPTRPSEQRLNARLLEDPYAAYDRLELEDDRSGNQRPRSACASAAYLSATTCAALVCTAYNMFTPGDDWVPGDYATAENIAKVDVSRASSGLSAARKLLAEASS